jgi:hypothetical protein
VAPGVVERLSSGVLLVIIHSLGLMGVHCLSRDLDAVCDVEDLRALPEVGHILRDDERLDLFDFVFSTLIVQVLIEQATQLLLSGCGAH